MTRDTPESPDAPASQPPHSPSILARLGRGLVRTIRRVRNVLPAGAAARTSLQRDGDDPTAPSADILDIYVDNSTAAVLGKAWVGIPNLPADGAQDSAEAMAPAMIRLLRHRADLRARFPRALSDGSSGRFGTWMKGDGLQLLGLDASTADKVDAAFAADFAAPALQRLIYDDGLRRQEPLFLLPNGRRAACRVLFDAHANESLSLTSIWWFLLVAAEDPMRELYATWAITPAWQEAVPAGGTAFGATALVRWVAETYDIEQDWLFAQSFPPSPSSAAQVRLAYAANAAWQARFPRALDEPTEAAALLSHLAQDRQMSVFAWAWLADQDIGALARDMTRLGVNILGHFSYPSGLRVSTQSIVEGLHRNDVATSLRDVPVDLHNDQPGGHAFAGCEIYDVTIVHVQPTPFFDQAYERAGLRPRKPRTYRIGFWYWELDTIPEEWDGLAKDCDELWTASRFVADGLLGRYKQPVKVFCPGIELPAFRPLPRPHFGLDPDRFTFLFVFHMRSIFERKNPLGLIKAFKTAFAPSENVQLVIKVMSGMDAPEKFAQLQADAEGANIILIDAVYSREETLSLIGGCDAYVSLHRSEGLGLTMAEAMLLGRPVIATRYSGNLEFMDDANSLLVDCELVTLDSTTPPYEAGQKWGAPSLSEAARHMRRLFDQPEQAQALGARARKDLEVRLSCRAAGERMKARLDEITAQRAG